MFWEGHDFATKRTSQYKSAIFYHNEEQKRLAEESAKEVQMKSGRRVATEILPAEDFYDAEEYVKYRCIFAVVC